MKSLNRVAIIGNLGADADQRFGASGAAVVTLSVATSESWKDKESGEKQERTEWHRVKCFGKLAEFAAGYKKGQQVFVEGQLRTTKYTKDGVEKYSTDIVAANAMLLGAKPASTEAAAAPAAAAETEDAPF